MDAEERYMNSDQLAFFEEKLFANREYILGKIKRSLKKIQHLKMSDADILDRSNVTFTIEQEVKSYQRYSHYLNNIDAALSKIRGGTYGFCELTGTEIGLKRLEAQPWTILSIEALEALEFARHHNLPVSTKAYA